MFLARFTNRATPVDEGTLVLEGLLLDAEGNPLVRHELWRKAGGEGQRVIFPKYSDKQTYRFKVPENVKGPLFIKADLNFRRYRQEFLDLVLPNLEEESGFHQPTVTKHSTQKTIATISNKRAHAGVIPQSGRWPLMITGLPSPPSAGQDRKVSKRMRRARLSIWVTIGGMLALGTLALLLDRRQDTDLADPTEGLTADFKSSAIAETTPLRFADQARERGINFSHGPGTRTRMLPEDTAGGLAWGDVDGDGDWDLYIVNFPTAVGDAVANANRLYRNDGGQFTDITNEAGVADPEGFGMGASFADYDGDGDQDLYVSNNGPNRLFRNSRLRRL